jgi:hypothetical protein
VSSPWYSAVQDGSRIQEHIAVRLFIFFEPYLVEQERMANAQLLMYGSKHLEHNFFFLKKCEYPMVLSDLEIPPDLNIVLNLVLEAGRGMRLVDSNPNRFTDSNSESMIEFHAYDIESRRLSSP